jgi:hypothetical protein
MQNTSSYFIQALRLTERPFCDQKADCRRDPSQWASCVSTQAAVRRTWQPSPRPNQLLELVGTRRAGASVNSRAIERLSSVLDRISIVD